MSPSLLLKVPQDILLCDTCILLFFIDFEFFRVYTRSNVDIVHNLPLDELRKRDNLFIISDVFYRAATVVISFP